MTLDALYQQEQATADPGARQQIFEQIHQIYLTEFPFIVLYSLNDFSIVRKGTHNYQPRPFAQERPSTSGSGGAIRGSVRGKLIKSMINGVAGSSATGGNLDFLVDRGEVVVDGARADHQLFGDLCIGHSSRQQTQDLDFTGGQAVGIGGCWLR